MIKTRQLALTKVGTDRTYANALTNHLPRAEVERSAPWLGVLPWTEKQAEDLARCKNSKVKAVLPWKANGLPADRILRAATVMSTIFGAKAGTTTNENFDRAWTDKLEIIFVKYIFWMTMTLFIAIIGYWVTYRKQNEPNKCNISIGYDKEVQTNDTYWDPEPHLTTDKFWVSPYGERIHTRGSCPGLRNARQVTQRTTCNVCFKGLAYYVSDG